MYDGGHPAIIIQQVYDTSPNPPEELAGRIASGWEG